MFRHSFIEFCILCVGTIVMLYKHGENIRRIRNGTEIELRSAAKGENRVK